MSVHTRIVQMATQDSKTRDLIRTVLVTVAVVLAVAGGLWLIWTLSTLLIVLSLSAFLAYLISPLVDLCCRSFALFGRRRCLPRGWAILLVYALIGTVVAAAVAVAAPRLATQFSALTSQMSAEATSAGLQRLLAWFNRLPLDPSVRTSVEQVLARAIEVTTTAAQAAAMSVLAWVSSLPWLVLIPIFAFFLLKDAEALRDAFVAMAGDETRQLQARGVLSDVNDALAAYIRAQLLACLIVGVITGVGFMVIGVPYALVLGVFAGVMESIPLVGPGIVAVVVAGLSLFHGFLLAAIALAFIAVVRILEDYVIYPRLIGRHIDLPPFAVIIAVLSGAEIGGVTGVLLAIPVLATGIILVRHLRSERKAKSPEAA
jgi:predicted PurR-regulated permease PerM